MIADDSDMHQVLLADKDAEYFLGCTAKELSSNVAIQDILQEKLRELVESGRTMEFYILSYNQTKRLHEQGRSSSRHGKANQRWFDVLKIHILFVILIF